MDSYFQGIRRNMAYSLIAGVIIIAIICLLDVIGVL